MTFAPAALLLAAFAQAPAPDAVVVGALGAQLDDFVARCHAFGFAGTVLVEKDGATILAKGYGLAERASGRANAADTVFDIGSLTKQFTAALVLRLEQEGRLATSDTLAKYFPEAPADKRTIQLLHLLAHTSGLPRGHERVGSVLQDPDELARLLFATKLGAKPGAQHVYSNVGYDLLGVVVEKVTGQPFETALRERIFVPAGMKASTFRGDVAPQELAARGYETAAGSDLVGSSLSDPSQPARGSLATEGWYSWGLRGAGGVLSTVGDLQLWHRALAGDAILGAAAKEKLFRPVRDDYACGWYVMRSDRGARLIAHGGSTDNGFACRMSMVPEQHLLVVVLGNVGDGVVPWVEVALAKLARGEPAVMPPAVHAASAQQLADATGTWVATDGAQFGLEVDDGALVLSAENASALALLVAAPPTTKAQLEASASIATALAQGRAADVHAHMLPERPLTWFDGWWARLVKTHGPVAAATLLGAADVDGAQAVLVDVRFERGREILRLQWTGAKLSGIKIGAPYPSRIRLVPTAANRCVRYDLTKSKASAELELSDARTVLKLGGKDLVLRRRTK